MTSSGGHWEGVNERNFYICLCYYSWISLESVSGKTLAVGFWHMEECGKNVLLQKNSGKISFLSVSISLFIIICIFCQFWESVLQCVTQDEINFKNSYFSPASSFRGKIIFTLNINFDSMNSFPDAEFLTMMVWLSHGLDLLLPIK